MFLSLLAIGSIVKKNIKQLLNQKSVLALTIVAPAMMLFIMSVVFSDKKVPLRFAVYKPTKAFTKVFETSEREVWTSSTFTDKDKMMKDLWDNKHDVGIDFEKQNKPEIYLSSVLFQKNMASLSALTTIMVEMQVITAQEAMAIRSQVDQRHKHAVDAANSTKDLLNIKDSVHYIFPVAKFSMFETLGPGILGMMIVFFMFVGSGMSFLAEKTSGTLERIMISPLKLWELIIGYLISFGMLAVLQLVCLQLFYTHVLGLKSNTSFGAIFLVGICTSFTSIALGMLVSAFAETEFTVMQTIPIMLVPQVAFSGLFDLSGMSKIVQIISDCLPMTYCVRALQKTMLKDLDLMDIKHELLVLVGIGVLFLLINYFALRKYKPRYCKTKVST